MMSFLLTKVSVEPVSAIVFVGEIVKVDHTQNCKDNIMSINQHIEECATESGIDLEVSNSNEQNIEYKGHIIEVCYNEMPIHPLRGMHLSSGIGTIHEESRVVRCKEIKIDGLC